MVHAPATPCTPFHEVALSRSGRPLRPAMLPRRPDNACHPSKRADARARNVERHFAQWSPGFPPRTNLRLHSPFDEQRPRSSYRHCAPAEFRDLQHCPRSVDEDADARTAGHDASSCKFFLAGPRPSLLTSYVHDAPFTMASASRNLLATQLHCAARHLPQGQFPGDSAPSPCR